MERQPKFFIGHPARSDDGDFAAGKRFQLERRLCDRNRPIGAGKVFSRAYLRFEQPAVGLQVIEIEPAVIAHPTGVDCVILARRLPVNDIFARTDNCIATSRAARADTFCFLQKPYAHFETKIGRSERADRTNIHRVERIIVLQPLVVMRG